MKIIRLNELTKRRAAPSPDRICGWVSFYHHDTMHQPNHFREERFQCSVAEGVEGSSSGIGHRRCEEEEAERRVEAETDAASAASASIPEAPEAPRLFLLKRKSVLVCQFQRFQSMVRCLCGRQHSQNVHPRAIDGAERRKGGAIWGRDSLLPAVLTPNNLLICVLIRGSVYL